MTIWAMLFWALLLPLLAQWLILRWTERRRWLRSLRFVMLALPVYLGYQGWWRLHAPWEEYPHHEGLAGFLLCAGAVLILVGWGLAWAPHNYGGWGEKP